MSPLEAAYRATSYRVEHPDGAFTLRVGVRSRTLDRLLSKHGLRTWAYVTAWNPFSTIVPTEENLARQRWLEDEAARRWWPSFAGRGVGPGWAVEPSLLILGIVKSDAVLLGREQRQAAIVVGELQQPARLVWLTDVG